MKLTVFLILLGLLRVSGSTSAQTYRVNLKFDNVALSEVLDRLKEMCISDRFMVDTFHFEYNINTKKFVTIDTITKKKPTPPSKKKFVFGTYSPDSTYVVYALSLIHI